jgi:hypothetical protein
MVCRVELLRKYLRTHSNFGVVCSQIDLNEAESVLTVTRTVVAIHIVGRVKFDVAVVDHAVLQHVDILQFGGNRVFAVTPDGDADLGAFVDGQVGLVPAQSKLRRTQFLEVFRLEPDHLRGRLRRFYQTKCIKIISVSFSFE